MSINFSKIGQHSSLLCESENSIHDDDEEVKGEDDTGTRRRNVLMYEEEKKGSSESQDSFVLELNQVD